MPGDFNLNFLDHVEDDADLNWVGNTNELNGSYAADGYSRVMGCSFFVSTCGVGELSALNGFAGSFAEQIPVIHLVGTPATKAIKAGKIMHHTLGPGHSPECFPNIWKSVTVQQVNVNESTTPEQIDVALETCIKRNQPIYISLPQDLVNMPLPAKNLKTPLNFDQPGNYLAVEAIVIDHIVNLLKSAEAPVLLFDAGAARDHILAECDALLNVLPNVPYFVSSMGKGSVTELLPNFAGCYAGKLSLLSVREAFESSDLVLFVGHIPTDMNTGMFSYDTTNQKVIELHAQYTLVRGGKFDQCGMKNMLPNLVSALQKEQITSSVAIPTDLALPEIAASEQVGVVRYPFFWHAIQSWLQNDDIIFAEPGTCGFGITDLKLPLGATVAVQYLWASIGFGTAALVGGAVAARAIAPARKRRVIGFLGDGSYQMSFNEISNLVRYDLDATIFLINNRGYTVEKFLHGVRREYNEINSNWSFHKTLEYYGGSSNGSRVIDSESALASLLQDTEFNSGRGVKFIEVRVATMDAGRLLTQIVKQSGRWDETKSEPIDFDEHGKAYP